MAIYFSIVNNLGQKLENVAHGFSWYDICIFNYFYSKIVKLVSSSD